MKHYILYRYTEIINVISSYNLIYVDFFYVSSVVACSLAKEIQYDFVKLHKSTQGDCTTSTGLAQNVMS